MKKLLLFLSLVLCLAYAANAQCLGTVTGTIVPGVECNLIQLSTGEQLLPCQSPASLGDYVIGDVLSFDFVPMPDCISFCQQGIPVTITCIVEEAVIIPSDTICVGGQGVQIGNQQLPNEIHQWVPSEGLSCDDCGEPLATPTSTTLYTHLVLSTFCIECPPDTFYHEVIVEQCVCVDSALICDTCPCTDEYEPVCGCNNITYGNTCEAIIKGVTAWTPGLCTTASKDIFSESVQVYPNPANDIIDITILKNVDYQYIALYNQFGKVLLMSNIKEDNNLQLDVQHIPNGLYYLGAKDKKGVMMTQKVMVLH